MVDTKKGPLTADELMTLWKSVVEDEYSRPLLEKPNSNIEAIRQLAEQLAKTSEAVDINTQAMFILPWSGQTNPSASGEAFATTNLTLTRNQHMDLPIVLTRGLIQVQHRLNDWGLNGPVDVTTNRVYTVSTTTVLMPGEVGPSLLPIAANNPGPGYNLPTENTLRTILQPGAGFYNVGATVVNGVGSTNQLIATTFPDVPVIEHVGQYILFTGGANAGQYRRIVGIDRPDPSVPHGGVFQLAAEVLFDISANTGVFSIGERIEQATTGASGLFLGLAGGRLLLQRVAGTFSNTGLLSGEFGATATPTLKTQSETQVPEIGGAAWLVVPWADLGIAVTNLESPTGGLNATLDELGNERGLPRFTGESDEAYSRRISRPADVVSPGAIIRAGNGVLAFYDESLCLREVGQPLFPGIFYDGHPNQQPFAYDLDLVELSMVDGNQYGTNAIFYDTGPNSFFDDPAPRVAFNFYSTNSVLPGGGSTSFIPGEQVYMVDAYGVITYGVAQFDYSLNTLIPVFRGVTRVHGPGFQAGRMLTGRVSGWSQHIATVGPGLRPDQRFYTYLNLREFRGFFIVGVPRLALDDFGFFYDFGATNAFDSNSIDNFFDGSALGNNSVYSRVWNAVNAARAAGVPFDMYIEDVGCV